MRIFLGIPTYDYRAYWHVFDSVAFALEGSPNDWRLIPRNRNSSLLGHCFNMLYSECFNLGCDVFAMCHADIQADPGWLYAMAQDLTDEYPVLSAVIPIKDDFGFTSTAVAKVTEGKPARAYIQREHVTYRLRLEDLENDRLYAFDDLSEPIRSRGDFLCINTGLWCMRMKQPWSDRVYFEIRSWTCLHDDGLLACGMLPEDWNFSRLLHILGVKPRVTTRIRAKHLGTKAWHNDPGLARQKESASGDPGAGPGSFECG